MTNEVYYKASAKKVSDVTVPPIHYLMIDGTGNPNDNPTYAQAVSTLYSVSYKLKFMIKKAESINYKVMPLEGLWWAEDMTQFNMEQRDNWLWTMMIAQPDVVTAEKIEAAATEAAKKKDLPRLDDMRFEVYEAGRAAQIMHIGPYGEEAPTIARLHDWISDNGFGLRGKHQEIYLSDPNRAKPENMKTIIRQPFA